MLKLKRASGPEQITLSMAVRQPLFNRDFTIAFAWAVGLHAAAFLLFTISALTYTGSNSLFPPVAVIAEPIDNGGVVAEANPSHISGESIPKPPAMAIASTTPSLVPDVMLHAANIFKLEAPIPDWPTPTTHPPAIRISATGHLAEYPVSIPPMPKLRVLGDYLTTFQVRVDGKTGKVFWFKLHKSSGNSLIDRTAEKMLRALAFETDHTAEINGGLLEFAFHLEPTHD